MNLKLRARKMLNRKNREFILNHRTRLSQRGSVLPISLFILLVLTIIGATSLNDTVMEEKMSSNFQNGHVAFQAAESSINRTFVNLANNLDLLNAVRAAKIAAVAAGTDPVWPTVDAYTMERTPTGTGTSSSAQVHSETTLEMEVRYVGENLNPPAGCSVVAGRGNSCKAIAVDLVGTGTITGTTVSRTHIQGTQKLVPGG